SSAAAVGRCSTGCSACCGGSRVSGRRPDPTRRTRSEDRRRQMGRMGPLRPMGPMGPMAMRRAAPRSGDAVLSSQAPRNVLVGLFFLVAIILFVVISIILSDAQEALKPTVSYRVRFDLRPGAAGLSEGAPVN